MSAVWITCPLVGAALGALTRDWGAALLGGVAGVILAWAIVKGAVAAYVRGALIGTLFLTLAGPGLDYVISGSPIGSGAVKAAIAGALIGALLGVRNYRPPKKVRAAEASIADTVAS